ncbi:MAG: ComF family protein [Clostridia bacterium]|jgi:competence protein ComFC|nr:ComF family protein [Clostridia bacterium]
MKGQAWWNAILNIFFPENGICLFCLQKEKSAEYMGICTECADKILEISENEKVCPTCGYFTGGQECPNCRNLQFGTFAVGSVVPYEGMFRELIHDLKYNGREELARPLGYLMARRVKRLGMARNIRAVVPVPLYYSREEERGFNQSLLLAKAIAEDLGKPLWSEALSREHFHQPQMLLTREERLKNIMGAFKYSSDQQLSGKAILLVDDIITTGATLRACADVLRQAGAEQVYGITWAGGYNVKLLERIAGSWFYRERIKEKK